MMQYLEVGAMTSNLFSVPVPYSVWDDQVSTNIITPVVLIFINVILNLKGLYLSQRREYTNKQQALQLNLGHSRRV